MSIIINGHGSIRGSHVLIIEGRHRLGSISVGAAQSADSKAIANFLRDNLPCGTLDMVAARLAGNALDLLIGSNMIDRDSSPDDVCEAIKAWVARLDKEVK